MKNYLGNLIARHLNQAEVLQPRLASQFEPQSSVLQTNAEMAQPQTGVDDVATASPEFETSATESPTVPDVKGPVTHEPVQPQRSVGKLFDSSVAQSAQVTLPVSQQADAAPLKSQPSINVVTPPAEAPVPLSELNEPAIVLTGQREKHIEPAESSAPPSQRDEVLASETPVVETDAGPLPAPPSPTPKTQRARTMDPVAVRPATETVEERPAVESDPPHSNTKPSARTRPPRPSQILTPSSTIELQPQVAVSATAKELAVPDKISRPTVHNAAPPEILRDTEPVKPQHTEAPAAVEHLSPLVLPPVVTPAPAVPTFPAIDSAGKQTPIRVSPAQPKPTSETRPPHQTQRVPFFETREMSAAQNQPLSARQKFSEEETAAEVGPTVNVTIGRIEVRAATQIPEAQPQKQRREHQVLSLDEYLSQRSAGGR